MNDLVFKSEKGSVVTNSLLVAEKFGKEHKHVMECIRKLTAENSTVLTMFYKTTYLNTQNKEQPMYIMNRDGFSLLVMSFTGEKALKFKIAFIEAFNQMEEHIKSIGVPQTFAEALRLAADKAEENERLMLENQSMQPKALFADAVTTSNSEILIGDLAKLIKQNGHDIGAVRLFEWMRKNGYLISRIGSDYNSPTQKSMDLRLFRVKETAITHSDGHVTVNKTPKVTGKGQVYFINKFLKK